mmetsp:Transcript_24621/g.38255  ORF Transcript_24621/g.38255 Transcript_24621/m.38255 type:complete len:147 (+) Transcript_24621:271-711(+)
MQLCEQKVLKQGKKVQKHFLSRLWKHGVMLYSLSLPLVITSNVLYLYNSKFHMQDDFRLETLVHYNKQLDEGHNLHRMRIIEWSHFVPAITFGIDLLVNKIRIPFRQIWITILFTALYLGWTFMAQLIQQDEAPYLSSLNWNCKYD